MNEIQAELILRTLAKEDLLFCHHMTVNARPNAYKRLAELVNEKSMLNEFHKANIARQHEAFAPPHSIMALVACVSEEVGELAGAVLGITGEKKRKAHKTKEDVLDAVADIMTYLSLVAGTVECTDLEGLLLDTFNMVSERVGSKITVSR